MFVLRISELEDLQVLNDVHFPQDEPEGRAKGTRNCKYIYFFCCAAMPIHDHQGALVWRISLLRQRVSITGL